MGKMKFLMDRYTQETLTKQDARLIKGVYQRRIQSSRKEEKAYHPLVKFLEKETEKVKPHFSFGRVNLINRRQQKKKS